MNILHVVQCYNPPVFGGAETYIKELSEHLVLRNHTVTVFTSNLSSLKPRRQVKSGKLEINGVFVNYFRTMHLPPLSILNILNKTFDKRFRSMRNVSLALRLFSHPQIPYLVQKIGFGGWDVVSAACFPWSSAVLAYYGAKIANLPYIVTPLFHVGHPEYECYSFFELLRKSDAIIVQTDYESAYLSTKSVPEDKMYVVGAGVNPEEFSKADGERFKEKYGLCSSRVILFIGHRISSKGIFTLIESMKYVKKSFPDIRLVIAGRSGIEYDNYYSTIPPSLKSVIMDVGILSRQEKADAFAAADIFVMPSKFESIGLVYLEAWMCGIPVIGAYSKTLSRVIRNGEDGFLIDFDDSRMLGKKIVFLLKNDSLRIKMGKIGREKVLKNHTWNKISDKIETIYKNVVNNYQK
jgi:glycosyltransferase involved in cell wall biosynthesis